MHSLGSRTLTVLPGFTVVNRKPFTVPRRAMRRGRPSRWTKRRRCSLEPRAGARIRGLLADGIAGVEAALRLNPNHADAWAFMTDLIVLDGSRQRHRLRAPCHAPQSLSSGCLSLVSRLGAVCSGSVHDAVTTLRHEATHRQGSQRILAASLAQLGRVGEARVEGGQFLSACPEFTASRWGSVHPSATKKIATTSSTGI